MSWVVSDLQHSLRLAADGYEAARRIRAQPGGRKIALVALTGWGQDEDRNKSKDAGFDGHLVKPLEYAALTKLLAEVRSA